jgi:hypothetical protein
LDTNLVLPVAVDRCVIVFDWFHRNASPTQNAAENAALLSSLGTSRAIQVRQQVDSFRFCFAAVFFALLRRCNDA